MIRTILASNVNEALGEALWWLKTTGVVTTSRNGAVLAAPVPVVTTYKNPMERVMFSELRDANPFFHLMESVWMLAGAEDVAFPAAYAKQIRAYSDDGVALLGAYGYRWRKYWDYDQLTMLIDMLRKDPHTRRAVLCMWDANNDPSLARSGGLDVPCNTHAYFGTTRGVLDMTVCCRSNDAVWGAYGANAVHFSMLLQFMAEATGIPIGQYTQFSNNLHVYLERPDVERLLYFYGDEAPLLRCDVRYQADDRYANWKLKPVQLIASGERHEEFTDDAKRFVTDPDGDGLYGTDFFAKVVAPMQNAHVAHKLGDRDEAKYAASFIKADDWRIAVEEWLGRRYAHAA
jgi:thymidylate synthase